MSDVLVKVTDLSVDYITDSYVERALSGVSLEIEAGSITALVGESGSGKSTLANAIAGLLPSTAVIGESSGVILGGLDLVGARPGEMQALRGSFVGFVPQDPRRSLHPLKRIGDQIAESLLRHRVVPRREVDKRVEELLEKVGIDDPGLRRKQFPHQFSGGMQQRVLIAIALAANPRLVVADEPTSALDVTVQKQILTLLSSLARTDGVAVLLVTHDLALAANYSQQIYVMHRGRIVESGSTSDFFKRPTSQYARELLNASPRLLVSDIEPPREEDTRAPILSLQDVTRRIRVPAAAGRPARDFLPVDEVSFSVGRGKTVALVGESGAGKTTAARIALGLERADSGRVVFDGDVVARLGRVAQREFRRRTQLIPQNPAVSFDPRWTVEEVIQEPLIADKTPRSELGRRTLTLLDQVGLPRVIASKRALELSGGQQQRVAIARAVSRGPELIVCDEPTSALDVTVQALIVALLRDLQEASGVSLLFVTHDLALVSEIAHDVVVMRSGRVVEAGSARTVLNAPTSAYTKELLAVVPQVPAPIVANRDLARVQ